MRFFYIIFTYFCGFFSRNVFHLKDVSFLIVVLLWKFFFTFYVLIVVYFLSLIILFIIIILIIFYHQFFLLQLIIIIFTIINLYYYFFRIFTVFFNDLPLILLFPGIFPSIFVENHYHYHYRYLHYGFQLVMKIISIEKCPIKIPIKFKNGQKAIVNGLIKKNLFEKKRCQSQTNLIGVKVRRIDCFTFRLIC